MCAGPLRHARTVPQPDQRYMSAPAGRCHCPECGWLPGPCAASAAVEPPRAHGVQALAAGASGSAPSYVNMLWLLLRLRQACNHPWCAPQGPSRPAACRRPPRRRQADGKPAAVGIAGSLQMGRRLRGRLPGTRLQRARRQRGARGAGVPLPGAALWARGRAWARALGRRRPRKAAARRHGCERLAPAPAPRRRRGR